MGEPVKDTVTEPVNNPVNEPVTSVLAESVRVAIDQIPEEVKRKPKVYKTGAKTKRTPEELKELRTKNLVEGRKTRSMNATLNAQKRRDAQASTIAEELYKKLLENGFKLPECPQDTPSKNKESETRSNKEESSSRGVHYRGSGRRFLKIF